MRRHSIARACCCVAAVGAILTPAATYAQPTPEQGARSRPATTARDRARHLAPEADLKDLFLLKVGAGNAVVRFGSGPLLLVAVGDRIGRPGARVKEIEGGRLALEERFAGADGVSNIARIILKRGDRGGTRYLARPEEQAPRAVRPAPARPERPEKEPPPRPGAGA